MVSARTGGLAVAFGIGCALAAGVGVASADTPDGPAGSESSSSASSDSSSASAKNSGDSPETKSESDHTRDDEESGSSRTDADDDDRTTADESTDTDAPEPNTDSQEESKRGTETADVTADEPEAEADSTPPRDSDSVVVEVAAQTESESVIRPDVPVDTPAPQQDSIALAQMVSSARREPAADAEQTDAAPVASVTTLAPSVVAIEQVAPLAFLQDIPLIGPTLVTPVVAYLHQIPVVGDVLHPLVGYPIPWGLPAGAPRPRDVKVTSSDGTQIYVHFMPSVEFDANGKAPTVLNGPGLGLPGATNIDGTFLDPVLADAVGMISVGTLRHAGYNVVTWDPRGEWNSGGTLELNGAEFEGRDMSAIISWIAAQPEVLLDAPGDPRLGMVGVSYGGGIQLVTAANDKRVDAIVPAITYNRLDTSLYKAGAFKSSWATPLTAVLQILGGRINPRILPATIYGDLTGKLLPSDLALFQQRNPAIGNITVPTLIIHGTVDNLFSLAEADATAQVLLAKGVPTKVIWFCGGHGVCANNLFDLRDGQLIERRTLEWLDKYVMKSPSTETGPQFEWVDQRGQWFSSQTYPATKGAALVASIGGRRTLPLIPLLGGSGLPFVPFALPALNAVNVKVSGNSSTTYLVGAPKLTLTYSGTGSASHVYAQLVDNTSGLVLGSIATPIPMTLDGDTHTIAVDLEPVAHTLRPGESLTLQLMSSAGLYEKILPSFGALTVTGLQVSVPTAVPSASSTGRRTVTPEVA